MKYAFELCSDAMIYISGLIKTDLGIQKLMGGEDTDTQTAW
jgi:hypothetical protein